MPVLLLPPARGSGDPRRWSAMASRRWGGAWADAEANDPALPDVHWCVSIRLGSATHRISTSTVTLRSVAGSTYTFAAGLDGEDLEVEDSYTPGEPSSGARSVSLAVPNRIVAAQSQVAGGQILAGTVEVFLAASGMTFEDRLVVLDGDVTGGVTFGTVDGSLVEFSGSDPRETASLPLTPYMIDGDSHPNAAEDAVGQRYPWIFNAYDGVSAYLVIYGATATALVCAAGRGLEVSAVYVNGTAYSSGHAAYAWNSAVLNDGNGTAYLAIQFTGTHVWVGDEQVTCDVSGGADTYLHEAIRSILEGWTSLGRSRIHYGLLGEVQARLGSVDVRCYVNGSTERTSARAIEVVEDVIGKSFPMITMATVDGRYGPVVTDARHLPMADLVLGQNLLARETDVEESDKADLVNHFVLYYDYDYDADAYRGVVSRHPGNSVLCRRSYDVVGARYADVVESTEIVAATVADYVVDWMVFHRSMPSYYVEYACPLSVALRLTLGWNVRLTDPDFYWSRATATVTRRVLRRGVCTLGLRLWWPNIAGGGLGGGAASGGGGGGGGGQ